MRTPAFLLLSLGLSLRLATAGVPSQAHSPYDLNDCALEAVSQSVDPFRILLAPNPYLEAAAAPIRPEIFDTVWLKELVLRMTRTLLESGGVGLAAPQIGQSSRVFLVRVPEKALERHPKMQVRPLTTVINPEITILDPELLPYREGCLSIPGKTGIVHRSQHIRVRYQDLEGLWHSEEVHGPNAVIFQHENDHLNGVLISSQWTSVEAR